MINTIINTRLRTAISLHGALHGFIQGKGMGTAMTEAKLAQQLPGIFHEPIITTWYCPVNYTMWILLDTSSDVLLISPMVHLV